MTEVRNKNDFNEYIESLLVNYESDERAPLISVELIFFVMILLPV